jgi:hypothetical protein
LANEVFEEVIVETYDVGKELTLVAQKFNLKPHQLDFSIQGVRTFEKYKNGNDDWIELEKGMLKRLDDDEYYTQSGLEIRQMYKVRIFLRSPEKDPFRTLQSSLVANKDLTQVTFTIKEGTTFQYNETFERDFIDLVNKRKVKVGILINFREGNFREEVKKLLERRQIMFKKDLSFTVAIGIHSKEQIDDKLEFLYKNQVQTKDEYGKVDHSQRGFVISVASGDTVIRYRKPKVGQIGRDCRGKALRVAEPKNDHLPDFKVTENIEVLDNQKLQPELREKKDESGKTLIGKDGEPLTEEYREDGVYYEDSGVEYTLYKAKKEGSIVFKDGVFDIDDNVETGALNFRTSGKIDAGTDNDVKLNVKEENKEKDAIGTGLSVTVATLNVDGNIGDKAKITAKEVDIGGQTHQTSEIICDKAKIATHKGKVVAEEVDIDSLEAGVIQAEVARVKNAIGGVIYAREVIIENLSSNIKIYSSKKIEVQNINGSENLFVIDFNGYKEDVKEIDETKEDIKNFSQKIEHLKVQLKDSVNEVLEIRKAFTKATNRLKKYRENDLEPPKSLEDSLQKYQDFIGEFKEMKDDLKSYKEKLVRREAKYLELQNSLLDAEIKVHDLWKGHNIIKFKLINPEVTLEKRVNDGDRESLFQIQKIKYEDNKYEIVTESFD